MNHDNQPNKEHPVDDLLSKALRDSVPSDAESLLLDRIDTFKPPVSRWRLPVTIGGSVAASLAIALVWGLMSLQAQPAHAWEQMRANLAKHAEATQFWLTQKNVRGQGNDLKLVLEGRAFARIKEGKGSRLDVYEFSSDRNTNRMPDKITFTRPNGTEVIVDCKDQTLMRIRSHTIPPSQPKLPVTLSSADLFIEQLIETDTAIPEGKELINGRPTLRYTVPADQMIRSTKDHKSDAEIQVWVDTEHSLPVQWRVHTWSTDEHDPWQSTLTLEDYVRGVAIEDSVFELPPETKGWNRHESWLVHLGPQAEINQPMRISVGLVDGTVLLTEQNFQTSGGRTKLVDGNKLRVITERYRGEILRVQLNDQLVAEHQIDWPINQITVFGGSYWLE